jgi:hypothetical protein
MNMKTLLKKRPTNSAPLSAEKSDSFNFSFLNSNAIHPEKSFLNAIHFKTYQPRINDTLMLHQNLFIFLFSLIKKEKN